VFREGEAGDCLYLIARGAVSIKVQLDAAAREVLRPGMAADVWLDKPPAATATTTQATQPL